MKSSRPRISVRMSRAISSSRPRATRARKNVWASETESAANWAMERSRHKKARATRLRRSPSQVGQVGAGPSYQAFQLVSSPVCSASKPFSCKPVPKQPGHQPCLELYRSEEHTSELQSRENLVCRLLLEK